jgi:hypothetical protein
MKLIDRSPYSIKPEGLDLVTRLRGVLEFGASWPGEIQAQQTSIKFLKRYLSDRFTLICNLKLVDPNVVIPMILVGPPGVFVIYASAIGGAFQAQGEEWLALKTGKGYVPTYPNLILQTCLMARSIDVFLKQKNLAAPGAQGVLLFTNPRIFVETVRSAARVVMSDALGKFAAGFSQAEPTLDDYAAEMIADALIASGEQEAPAEPETQVTATLPEKKGEKALSSPEVNFNRKQWTLLIILSLLLVCVLVTFIVILVNAG